MEVIHFEVTGISEVVSSEDDLGFANLQRGWIRKKIRGSMARGVSGNVSAIIRKKISSYRLERQLVFRVLFSDQIALERNAEYLNSSIGRNVLGSSNKTLKILGFCRIQRNIFTNYPTYWFNNCAVLFIAHHIMFQYQAQSLDWIWSVQIFRTVSMRNLGD